MSKMKVVETICEVEPSLADEFQAKLQELTGISVPMSAAVRKQVGCIFDALGKPRGTSNDIAVRTFYARLNQKLVLNAKTLEAIYGTAASRGVVFNYHQKKQISWSVDSGDLDAFVGRLEKFEVPVSVSDELIKVFGGVTPEQTRDALQQEMTRPSKLRKAHGRIVSQDVQDAAAGCLVWSEWPQADLRSFFATAVGDRVTDESYIHGLRHIKPELFDRKRSLTVRLIAPPRKLSRQAYLKLRSSITEWIASEFASLDNHGHLAAVIDVSEGRDVLGWELAGDLTLFAERHVEENLHKLYFRSTEIQKETIASIPEIDVEAARFDLAFDGFSYRDSFVLHDDSLQVQRLVVLFQKNQRDETLIPCPACRTTDVAGNSYPSLGVKSWECRNLLCPERSIYNRGKRYSLKALIVQEAIEAPGNEIPIESIRRWRRDVLRFEGDDDIVQMLTRHYSMVGDTVAVLGGAKPLGDCLGRKFVMEEPPITISAGDFWDSHFFKRYVTSVDEKESVATEQALVLEKLLSNEDSWLALEGDSRHVLKKLPESSVDRAVTSPPYFNAREYSQWGNLYCYLNEMLRIHEELFRVLKPGSFYAFNVFDYFDNERTITFSDMGKKRIALSALFVDLFRRIGFLPAGNVVWDKGDVEGKRAFNAGNPSPFYQAPLNCWEHILLFVKPGGETIGELPRRNEVRRIKPVFKMVRGENRHGHSAPFPIEVPLAVLDGLPSGKVVLDPFGGSGTTARAAMSQGLRSIVIERETEYHELTLDMVRDFERSRKSNESKSTLL